MSITGNVWKWFKSYRTQCISIINCLSKCLATRAVGCTTGKHIGFAAFLMDINDFPSAISSSNMFIFADDTKCFKAIKYEADMQNFQKDISSLSCWSTTNYLSSSIPKFVFMRYHSQFNSEYSIDGNIARTKVYIFLTASAGGSFIKVSPLKHIKHWDFYVEFTKIITAYILESVYASQSSDPNCCTVHVYGSFTCCLV